MYGGKCYGRTVKLAREEKCGQLARIFLRSNFIKNSYLDFYVLSFWVSHWWVHSLVSIATELVSIVRQRVGLLRTWVSMDSDLNENQGICISPSPLQNQMEAANSRRSWASGRGRQLRRSPANAADQPLLGLPPRGTVHHRQHGGHRHASHRRPAESQLSCWSPTTYSRCTWFPSVRISRSGTAMSDFQCKRCRGLQRFEAGCGVVCSPRTGEEGVPLKQPPISVTSGSICLTLVVNFVFWITVPFC